MQTQSITSASLFPDENTKVCKKCGKEKPLDGFYRGKLGKKGRWAVCKECFSRRNKPQTCPHCGETKLKRLFPYYRKPRKDGRGLWCIACQVNHPTRICYTCRQEKPKEDFGPDKQDVNGRRSRCNDCARTAWLGYMRKKNLAEFGITEEEYQRMFEAQSGVCAICGKPETMKCLGTLKKLAVDHDHETGKVRGLLCNTCNPGVGYFQDSPELLEKAAAYLRR